MLVRRAVLNDWATTDHICREIVNQLAPAMGAANERAKTQPDRRSRHVGQVVRLAQLGMLWTPTTGGAAASPTRPSSRGCFESATPSAAQARRVHPRARTRRSHAPADAGERTNPMSYSATVLADAPLAFYRLDETDSSSPVADASPHGANGQYNFSATDFVFQQPSLVGDSSHSVLLDNSDNPDEENQFIALGVTPFDGAIALECWVKIADMPQGADGQYYFFGGDGANTGGEGIIFRLVNNDGVSNITLEAGTFNGTSFEHVSWAVTGWTLNAPHHLVSTFDGSHWRIYFDGVLKATAAGTLGAQGNEDGAWCFGIHPSDTQHRPARLCRRDRRLWHGDFRHTNRRSLHGRRFNGTQQRHRFRAQPYVTRTQHGPLKEFRTMNYSTNYDDSGDYNSPRMPSSPAYASTPALGLIPNANKPGRSDYLQPAAPTIGLGASPRFNSAADVQPGCGLGTGGRAIPRAASHRRSDQRGGLQRGSPLSGQLVRCVPRARI